MPIYEFECPKHGRVSVRQSMDSERRASCPECSIRAVPRMSACNFRFATPLTVYQELPAGKGYQEVGWKPDSGISPKPGQPYKTPKEVIKEEHGGVMEV